MISLGARTFLRMKAEHRASQTKLRTFDVFRSADAEAEAAMMNPRPSAYRTFFAQWAPVRPEPTAAQRMDPSWPSASGARLSLLV